MTRLLPELYDARFDEREVSTKDAVWREIVGFLGRYIDTSWPVLDVACDRGHFIRWIDASERWATDIRDVSEHLPAGVRFTRSSGLEARADAAARPLRHRLHEQLPRTPRVER